MRFAYLGSAESWYLRDLQRAAGDRHAVVPVTFDSLNAAVGALPWPAAAASGATLRDFDAVLVRAMAPGSLEQVVFRMNVLGQLAQAGGVVVNSPRAVEAAVDKYLALAWLQAAGLLVPRTIVCQTADEALRAFDALGGDVVIKPIFGAEGRGILRVSDVDLAERVFRTLTQIQAVVYLQEYIDHPHCDYRLLVAGPQVLGMQRCNPHDWRTNISRGAEGAPLTVDDRLREVALRAAQALGGTLVGVDVVPDRSGRLYVVEVNAAPGWRGLAAATGIDVAQLVLEHLEQTVASRRAVVPIVA